VQPPERYNKEIQTVPLEVTPSSPSQRGLTSAHPEEASTGEQTAVERQRQGGEEARNEAGSGEGDRQPRDSSDEDSDKISDEEDNDKKRASVCLSAAGFCHSHVLEGICYVMGRITSTRPSQSDIGIT